ncbi:MAG: hydroxymethylglutaryl-CoA reductase, degradative [Candidatus Hydrothermarchaeota archaeon]
MKSSQISGFYKLRPEERLRVVKEFAGLTEEEAELVARTGALRIEQADKMIENVIGTMEVPLGVATNFLINGRDHLIPMATEEPSVVAAASNAAKMAREKGGFHATTTDPVMIGQIQLTGVSDPFGARMTLLAHKEEILALANKQDPTLVRLGGGAKDMEVRVLDSQEPMVAVHLLVNCLDAMGANAVNTMAEAVAPLVEELTGGRVYLRIISNLAIYRLARARVVFGRGAIGGEEVVEGILKAYAFAASDPFRAVTHNKGIMNGITAVALATGNDTRAVEAGAHAYASINGGYKPLTRYEMNRDGDLVGTIELPLAVGLVGGATAVHPVAKANVKILGVKTARGLAEVMASVGLAQNFAALRALATEGIQKGHMALHARNIAVMAGAKGADIDKIAEQLVRERKVRLDRAKELLEGR